MTLLDLLSSKRKGGFVRNSTLVGLVLGGLALPSVAVADEVEVKKIDKAEICGDLEDCFEKGEDYARQGNYDFALQALEKAYSLANTDDEFLRINYNLGCIHLLKGERENAQERFKISLTLGAGAFGEGAPASRESFATWVEDISQGRDQGIVEAYGRYLGVEIPYEVEEVEPVNLDVPEEPEVKVYKKDPPKDRGEKEPSFVREHLWTIVSGSAGALLVGGGAFFNLYGHSQLQELEGSCGRTPEGCSDSDIGKIETYDLLSKVSYGVGAGCFAAAVVLELLKLGDKDSDDVSVGPGGVQVRF